MSAPKPSSSQDVRSLSTVGVRVDIHLAVVRGTLSPDVEVSKPPIAVTADQRGVLCPKYSASGTVKSGPKLLRMQRAVTKFSGAGSARQSFAVFVVFQ